jgi:acyl carrier protein
MKVQLDQLAIEDVLVGIVQEITENKEIIDQSSSLFEDYSLDSIDFMELFIRIEEIYGIRIDLQEYLSDDAELSIPEEKINTQGIHVQETCDTAIETNPENAFDNRGHKIMLQDLNIEMLSSIILSKIAIEQPA